MASAGQGPSVASYGFDDDERQYLLRVPDSGLGGGREFRPIPTLWTAILESAIIIALVVTAFLRLGVDTSPFDADSPFQFFVTVHVGVWAVVAMCDIYFHYHHRVSRLSGYLTFYRQSQTARRIPFVVFSAGNGVIAILASLWDAGDEWQGLDRQNAFAILCAVEAVGTLPPLAYYTVQAYRFNKSRPRPDATDDWEQRAVNYSLGRSSNADATTSEMGFGDDVYVDEILEKQADMIRYLQQHNQTLSRRIVELAAQLDGLEGMPATVDFTFGNTSGIGHER